MAKYLPKFAKMQVAGARREGRDHRRDGAGRAPITIIDLMRHTSGLVYGGRGTTAVHKMYPG